MLQVLDKAMGIHDEALRLRAYRSNILASNLANSDTPGFKARDIDFKQVLSRQLQPGNVERVHVSNTHSAHMPGTRAVLGADAQYRNPLQASLDGNTVDEHVEHTRFAENTVQYQASLQFLSGKFRGLMTAIKGE